MSCEIPGIGLYSTTGPAAPSVKLTTLTPGTLAGVVAARASGRGMPDTLPKCTMPPASIAALKGPCLALTIVSCWCTTFRMSFTYILFFLAPPPEVRLRLSWTGCFRRIGDYPVLFLSAT
jgi:hypothetical protein